MLYDVIGGEDYGDKDCRVGFARQKLSTKKTFHGGHSPPYCTSFAVMERLRIDTAFSFDRHFKAMGFHVMPEAERVV